MRRDQSIDPGLPGPIKGAFNTLIEAAAEQGIEPDQMERWKECPQWAKVALDAYMEKLNQTQQQLVRDHFQFPGADDTSLSA